MTTFQRTKKIPNSKDKVCSNCHAPEGSARAPKLSACSRCGLEVYCRRECQRAHWKANHKQNCIAKADQLPQCQTSPGAPRGAQWANSGEECAICLSPLSSAAATILQCAHAFHDTCVAQLHKFGVQQACPLCRAPLPPGPDKEFEEATRRFLSVYRLVEREMRLGLPSQLRHSAN
jgi:hypothetical protein